MALALAVSERSAVVPELQSELAQALPLQLSVSASLWEHCLEASPWTMTSVLAAG